MSPMITHCMLVSMKAMQAYRFQEGRLMTDPSPGNAIFRPIISKSLRKVNLRLCIRNEERSVERFWRPLSVKLATPSVILKNTLPEI
jgi:hypothetical protein